MLQLISARRRKYEADMPVAIYNDELMKLFK